MFKKKKKLLFRLKDFFILIIGKDFYFFKKATCISLLLMGYRDIKGGSPIKEFLKMLAAVLMDCVSITVSLKWSSEFARCPRQHV